MPSLLSDALEKFAATVQIKFSAGISGEPEDQLRAPFETLLTEAGVIIGASVTPVGETLLVDMGKPDFGISVDKYLCGHAELKAPGKGAHTGAYSGHDAKQWKRFRDLPNILYTDGIEWALYRQGELVSHMWLAGDPRSLGEKAVNEESARELERVLRDFLPGNPSFLAHPDNSRITSRRCAAFCVTMCSTHCTSKRPA